MSECAYSQRIWFIYTMLSLFVLLFICAACLLSFHFIMLITFFFINHSRFALSCLEWKVKFISIKSKSFFFRCCFYCCSFFLPSALTTVNTHSKTKKKNTHKINIQMLFDCVLLLWAIDIYFGRMSSRDWFELDWGLFKMD